MYTLKSINGWPVFKWSSASETIDLINCAYVGTFVLNLILYLILLIKSISEGLGK